MPRVKLLGLAITSSHGTLDTGDIINVSDDFAAHLVNDCKVAEYLDVIEPTDTQQPAAPEAKKHRKTPKQAFEDAEKTAEQPAPEQAAQVNDAIETEGE